MSARPTQPTQRRREMSSEVENEIRTLTLRFASLATAQRFYALADRLGHRPSKGWDGVWHTVTAVFQNKAAKSKLLAAWTRESMVATE